MQDITLTEVHKKHQSKRKGKRRNRLVFMKYIFQLMLIKSTSLTSVNCDIRQRSFHHTSPTQRRSKEVRQGLRVSESVIKCGHNSKEKVSNSRGGLERG